MTAIADAELQKLFNKFALAYARAAVEADIEPDNAYDWGSSEARAAFIAALNERLEAADRMAQRIVVADQLVEAIDSMHHSMRYGMNLRTAEALAAYRQSKERR